MISVWQAVRRKIITPFFHRFLVCFQVGFDVLHQTLVLSVLSLLIIYEIRWLEAIPGIEWQSRQEIRNIAQKANNLPANPSSGFFLLILRESCSSTVTFKAFTRRKSPPFSSISYQWETYVMKVNEYLLLFFILKLPFRTLLAWFEVFWELSTPIFLHDLLVICLSRFTLKEELKKSTQCGTVL
jgi:hypothetical protein